MVAVSLRAIITAEYIEASEDEINAEAEKIGSQYGMVAEQGKKVLPSDQLAEDVKRNKAVDLIVGSAVVE